MFQNWVIHFDFSIASLDVVKNGWTDYIIIKCARGPRVREQWGCCLAYILRLWKTNTFINVFQQSRRNNRFHPSSLVVEDVTWKLLSPHCNMNERSRINWKEMIRKTVWETVERSHAVHMYLSTENVNELLLLHCSAVFLQNSNVKLIFSRLSNVRR